MNAIEAREAQLSGDEYLLVFVDGEPLDSLLTRLSGIPLNNLIPSWSDLFLGYPEDQTGYIWSRTRLDGGPQVLPLLLCPDDFDFGCTTVVVEVLPGDETVVWNRFGLDTTDFPAYIGGTVEWFSDAGPFVFDRRAYCDCVWRFLTSTPFGERARKAVEATAAEDRGAPSRLWENAVAFLRRIGVIEPPLPIASPAMNTYRSEVARMVAPWRETHFFKVGGLLDIGLDEEERYVLAGSTSGRGVFDLKTGMRVARDDDDSKGYADPEQGELEGIGPLAGRKVPVYGVYGREVPARLLLEADPFEDGVVETRAVLQTRGEHMLLLGQSDGICVFERR